MFNENIIDLTDDTDDMFEMEFNSIYEAVKYFGRIANQNPGQAVRRNKNSLSCLNEPHTVL
jgi:hypothetical protein